MIAHVKINITYTVLLCDSEIESGDSVSECMCINIKDELNVFVFVSSFIIDQPFHDTHSGSSHCFQHASVHQCIFAFCSLENKTTNTDAIAARDA